MSIYGNSVKTHIVDAHYNRANFRSEFRLEPDTLYYSSFRLANLGVEATTGGKAYNTLIGTYGTIKQISLYDENQLLDQLVEFGRFMSFKQYNKKNTINMDMSTNLVKNGAGSFWGGVDNANGTGSKIAAWTPRMSTTGKIGDKINNSQGWLDLKECLPILKSLRTINTSVFKNLKIVIEYSNDLDDYMNATDDTATVTFEPIMIVDEIIGQREKEILGKFESIQYVSIEHDYVQVPKVDNVNATNPNPTQKTTLRLGGFNNKICGKMMIAKSPTLLSNYKKDAANFRNGKWASFTNNKEVLQMRINGTSKISGNGIDRDNQRLAMLNDVWGVSSAYPFSNSEAYIAPDDENRSVYIHQGSKDIGSLDFYGLMVNELVQDLQIDFQRNGLYSLTATSGNDPATTDISPYNQAIDMYVFCEVFKEIVPDGNGSYAVNYL
jgi:hypothetical protein